MGEENTPEVSRQNLLRIAADIVAAYVSRNETDSARVPEIIAPVFEALRGLTEIAAETRREPRKPAVSVRRSVTADYIVCLEDGRKFKMLKRHLRTSYNMTPEEYRRRWNLPA
ncbi:MAG: MucR family transcriptional regulator, partial [Proteobacteria bacterium]|nr:MucR family transcriptional regulator [Pseudomonadota bacterium]